MSLLTEVQNRVSNQRLVELTNQDDQAATTLNTTVLNNAVADAAAEFLTRVGVAYDTTNAQHNALAVQGVLYFLQLWRGIDTEAINRMETRWIDGTIALGKVTSRNRVTPQTTSVLTPSPEQQSNETVRPDYDRDHFDGIVPGPPGRLPHFSRGVRDLE